MVILDACCVINLYASGRFREICLSLDQVVFIADYVVAHELLTVRSPDLTGEESIILQPLLDAGSLVRVGLDADAEVEAFVNFAAVMDDGEAMTAAIAHHRGWKVATDDRAAIAIFRGLQPPLEVVTTPELVKRWVDMGDPTPAVAAEALKAIRLRGRYAPGKTHPLYQWWHDILAGSGYG